jgi:integrase/recombinase XerD
MTVSIVLDRRRQTTTGENAGKYPIKIRLSYTIEKRTYQRLFPTGQYATDAEFKKIMGNPGKDVVLQDIKAKVHQMYDRGLKAVKDNNYIDPESFGQELTNTGGFKDPLSMMSDYARQERENDDIGNADYYDQACGSFRKFAAEKLGGVMTFGMVTAKMLFRYEKWMLDTGRSITTVGMYCRAMRRVFNIAIGKKVIPAGIYPFGEGDHLYQIPSAKGRKLALDEAQKDKILKYATLNPGRRLAVDMWVFSYFCQGMNFADVARLKYRDIDGEVLTFERAKSKRKRNKKPIIAIVRPEVREIIARHGNKYLSPAEYIFPVLRDDLTSSQIKDRIHDFIADVNKGLESACEEMGLPKITTYWARHTFATILKRKGATTEQIQEALGHADKSTTEAYMDSFDMDTKRKIANML